MSFVGVVKPRKGVEPIAGGLGLWLTRSSRRLAPLRMHRRATGSAAGEPLHRLLMWHCSVRLHDERTTQALTIAELT